MWMRSPSYTINVKLARAAQEMKIPYLASGGIADGRGFVACLALGAAVSDAFECRRYTP